MKERKVFKIYGCDYDPNPDTYALRRKLSRFISLGGRECIRGPYDIFIKFWDRLPMDRLPCVKGDKYPCPGYLSASPGFETEIYPETFRDHINSGGCRDYCRRFGEDYNGVFGNRNEIPVLFGVDHALTGGIVRELLKSEPDMRLVIFDAHFDGFSPKVRNDLVGYYDRDARYEYFGDDFTGNYDAGSFIHYLKEEGFLDPKNLSVFGVESLPSREMKYMGNSRIRAYSEEYDAYAEGGSRILSADALNAAAYSLSLRHGVTTLHGQYSLSGKKVYISVDADVLKSSLGAVTRYGGGSISVRKIIDILTALNISSAQIMGIDIMEIDISKMLYENVSEEEIFNETVSLLTGIAEIMKQQ
ncbi:MAG: arginase family protein [Clostridiales Family XIII bacterium]|jgi:arginase family enzyme|nr:arginase family protein [Clostridiales Family XIII bacterium]